MNETQLATKLKHQLMVRTLAKDPQLILTSLDIPKCNLIHACIGIKDEYFELQIAKTKADKENILEELGDLLFYSEVLIHGLEDELDHYKFCPLAYHETYQLLARTVKRNVFYEKDLTIKDLICVYKNLIKWIEFEASHIGKNIVDVQNHNMEKLALRYPNYQYTDTRATERADKVGVEDDTVTKVENLSSNETGYGEFATPTKRNLNKPAFPADVKAAESARTRSDKYNEARTDPGYDVHDSNGHM